jgi:hypothetical protein
METQTLQRRPSTWITRLDPKLVDYSQDQLSASCTMLGIESSIGRDGGGGALGMIYMLACDWSYPAWV